MTCKKTKFATEEYAAAYVKKLQKTSKRKVVPQRTYLCPECLTWHLTSLPAPVSEITKLHDQIKSHKDKSSQRLTEIKRMQLSIVKYKQKIQRLKSILYENGLSI